MRFERTFSALKALQGCSSDSLCTLDVLNVVHDLCDDVKWECGGGISELTFGENTSKTVTRLSWLGRTILKIEKEHKGEIGTFEEKAAKFSSLCSELNDMTNDIDGMDGITKKCEKKRTELNSKAEKLAQRENKKNALEEECSRLEQEIDRLSTIDVVKLEADRDAVKERLEQLKSKRSSIASERDDIELKVKSLNDSVTKLNNEVESKSRQCEELKSRMNTLDRQSGELSNKIVSLKADCHNIEDDIKKRNITAKELERVSIPSLEKSVKSSQDRLGRLNEKFCELSEQLEEIKSAGDDREEKISVLSKEIDDRKEKVGYLTESLEQLDNERSRLNTSLNELESKRSSVAADIDRLNERIVDYTERIIPELDDKSKNMRLKLDRSKGIYDQKHNDYNDLEDRLNVLASDIAEIDDRIELCSDAVAESEQRLDVMRLQEASSKDRLGELNRDKNTLSDSIASVVGKIHSLSDKVLPELKEKKRSAIIALDELEDSYAAGCNEFDALNGKIAKLNVKISDINEDIKEKKSELASVTEVYTSLCDEYNSANSRLEKTKEESDRLTEDIQAANDCFESYTEEKLPALQAKLNDAVKALDNIKLEFSDTEQQLKDKGLEADGVSERIVQCKKCIEETKSRIAELNEKLSALELSRTSLSKQAAEKEADCLALNEKIDEYKEKLSDYSERAIPELNAELDGLIKKISGLDDVIVGKRADISSAVKEFNSLHDTKNELTAELEDMRLKRSRVLDGIEELKVEREELYEQLGDLERKFIEINDDIEGINREASEYTNVRIPESREKLEKNSGELAELKSSYDKLLVSLADIQHETESTKIIEKVKKHEKDKAVKVLDVLTTSVDTLTEKKKELDCDIAVLRKENDDLEKKTAAKERELSDFKNNKLLVLKGKAVSLDLDLAHCREIHGEQLEKQLKTEEELRSIRQKISDITESVNTNEKEINRLKDASRELEERKLELERILNDDSLQFGELKSSIEEREEKLAEIRSVKMPDLQKKYDAVSGELEESRSGMEELQEKLDDVTKQLEVLCEKRNGCEKSIAAKQKEIDGLNEALRSMQSDMTVRQNRKKEIDIKISEITQRIESMDIEKCRSRLNGLVTELKTKQREYSELDRAISEQEERFTALTEAFGEKEKMLEDSKWKCEKQIRENEKTLEVLTQQVDKAEEKKSELLKESHRKESEYREYRAWFDGLKAKGCEENIRKYGKAVDIMKNAADSLARDIGFDAFMNGGDSRSNLDGCTRYFRDSIGEIEQKLKQLQRNYANVVHTIENGECEI